MLEESQEEEREDVLMETEIGVRRCKGGGSSNKQRNTDGKRQGHRVSSHTSRMNQPHLPLDYAS